MVTQNSESKGLVSKLRLSRKGAPIVAAYLVVSLLVWQYLTKFFSLSKEIIDEMAVSVVVNDLQLNESYYSLSNSLRGIGPIFLLLFTLACNEYRTFLSNPRNLRGYSKTLIIVLGFLLLFGLSNTFEFRAKSQVWMIMGGLLIAGVIILFDAVNGMLDSLIGTLRNPKNTKKIWFEAPIESSLTLLAISFYLIVLLIPVLLPAFSIYFTSIFENVVTFLSLSLIHI